jgi:hypothetical protein
MKISIKKYLGIIDGGIGVLCTILYDTNVYSALYWYNNENVEVLSVEPSLEEIINCKIEEHQQYNQLIANMNSLVGKYDDIVKELEIII